MTRALRHSVKLEGGRAHGRVVEVAATTNVIVEVVASTPHTYAAGEWATPDGPPVNVERVEIETYVRQDAETFFVKGGV